LPSFSFFSNKLKNTLSKSRESIRNKINSAFQRSLNDEDFWSDLEDALISSDIGVSSTLSIIEGLKQKVKLEKIQDKDEVFNILKELMMNELLTLPDILESNEPIVIIMTGVNGSGKTTTIGKIAKRESDKGKKVLVAAADTFRAAAIEQLEIISERAGVPIIKSQRGADAASVVHDAINAFKNRKSDRLIVDTAGRLQTYQNLMNELTKIKRISDREAIGYAQVKSLLVIDATTGQNGIAQAKHFNDAISIDGIVLTKLDGTAKGGIAIAISKELNIPLVYVGTGESIDDIQVIKPEEFVNALF